MQRIGRLLLVGLLLVLGSQFIALGWAGSVENGAAGDPLPAQDQLPVEPIEAEEMAEDGDDRLTWQVEIVAADGDRCPAGCPVTALRVRTAATLVPTLTRVFFRPPILL